MVHTGSLQLVKAIGGLKSLLKMCMITATKQASYRNVYY